MKDLWPVITIPSIPIPFVQHIALNELNRPKIDLSRPSMTIRWLSNDSPMSIRWLSRTFDLFFLMIIYLKRFIDRRWLFRSGATFILRWSCWMYVVFNHVNIERIWKVLQKFSLTFSRGILCSSGGRCTAGLDMYNKLHLITVTCHYKGKPWLFQCFLLSSGTTH